MSDSRMTVEDWLAELEAASRARGDSDEGETIPELIDRLGLKYSQVTRILREAQKQSRLKLGRRRSKRIDGVTTWLPVYRILPPPAPSKKPRSRRK